MPAWYRNARWVRGEIASEDDGSLHIAALSELYADGRHSMADGIDTHSFPRSFAFSVVAATERAHTRAGDSAAAWNSMPESARTIKLLEYLSCSGWPVQLDHWRTSSAALQADLHGMFMYTDCRGAGSAAERELLSSPFRARGVLQQLQPLWGVITLAPSFPLLQAALRALLSSASSPGRDVFITLDAAIAVNKMLAGALTHCTGASFAAKSFDDRVSIAKELVEKSFQLDRISAFGGLAAGGSSAGDVVSGGGSGTSKVAGKFDRVRLEQLKNDNDYNSTKRQLLKAHAGGEVDKAILIGLRGADSLVARPPGAPVVRLPPQKVLHDLLLGSNDKELEVYSVDKELEAAIPGLRRALPAFWGRRAAKALSIDHGKSIPLEALALFMASTGTWGTKPPDFYNEVLVPMRIADGDTADSVHASFNYVPGSDVYANATVVNAIADLVGNLLLDVGVHGEATVNDFADAGASDIVSTHDVFGMVAYVHARLGALPTTAGKISDLLRGLLGDWGTARSVVRSSSDPHRPLNVRFVELSSTRLFDFFKHKLEQTAGRDAAASMRAAGFHVEVSPQAPPAAHPAAPSASPTPAHAVGVVTLKRDSPEFLSEVQKEVRKQLKQHSGKGFVPDPEQGEPMTLVVTSNGARAHVTGDFRGAKGCLYLLSGPNGVIAALKRLAPSVGPIWWVALKSGMRGDSLLEACAASPYPADASPPLEEPVALAHLKLKGFRINEDGSEFVQHRAPGAGAGSGGIGGGGRGGGRGSGRGRGLTKGRKSNGKSRKAILVGTLGLGGIANGAPASGGVVVKTATLGGAGSACFAALQHDTSSGGGTTLGAPRAALHLKDVANELATLEAAAALQKSRRTAGLPPLDSIEVEASHEASQGPRLRALLAPASPPPLISRPDAGAAPVSLYGGVPPTELSQGNPSEALGVSLTAGLSVADSERMRRRLVRFAPILPSNVDGSAFGIRGRWQMHVGSAPRGDSTRPPLFACEGANVPELATVLVPVCPDGPGLMLKSTGDAVFGLSCDVESSRDAAVSSMDSIALTLLGSDTPYASYLAGEWVEPNLRWRVVLCVLGDPQRADMSEALRDGAAKCSSCAWACWIRSSSASNSRADNISRAALARALAATRPATAIDSRLQIGRGVERWADVSQAAAVDSRARLQDVTERMAVAQHDVQEYLLSKAADLRQLGDVQQALFFEGCAARVEPAPLGEVPASLVGEKLADADMQELAIRPFRRTTIISKTAAPSYKPRPTAFPPDLPTPTCHASFLLSEVMETCHKWHADADAWHQRRMAGVEAKRPKGVAWGLDAIKPEWRGFFADGGVAVFDEKTGTPSCLTLENYSLSHHLNGGFALREFADYPDREAVASIGDGISIKAQGLPALQLACNLEALYEAGGAEGVRCVADELRKFGKFDDTGWYLRAPSPSRKQGCLGTATLPSCATPIGAVPKKDGGTRIIIDLGFPYGKLKLNKIKEAPLPPDELWDGVSAYRPAGARPNESSITLGGGGAVAMPPNVASGPSRPPHGETYEAGGQWPWPYEAKSTVVEQAENDLILSVPCQAANLAVYHLGWDFWKCFHQSNYRAFELIATACVVPELNEEGEVADEQRGISNGRMAMGLSPASGFCQRNGNMGDWGVMRRFDARQEARRLTEPELPAVASWLDARRSLPPDAYGTQGRLACGGFYSDDPKYTVCGPVSRVGDLVHSFYEVMGPEGLGFRMAEPHKWLVACWAAWQGIRMSAMLGILWLPPAKSLRANEDLREFEQGRMVGAEFIKMMGFLNYLAEILAVPKYVNHTMWRAYDDHKELCDGTDVGVAVMRPQPAQSKAIAIWRKTIMTTPGTTLLRIVRRVPPPRDGVIVWTPSSDACMDTVVVDGVVVAGHLHGAVDVNGKKMHDPPGMGGALYGRLWQYPFTAAEIEVVTIPVAEFMAGPVGLIVLDGDGALEYAERICLEIDAEATPRTALQGEARSAGLLVAHDEFTKLPVYAKYKARLSGKHVFGAGNVSDPASRSRNSEAERLVRFLGLEPRWLPVPPEALDYVAAVVARLLSLKQAKKTPGSCDPAEPGGDAPRFGSPRLVSRRASFISAVPPSSSPSLAGSPRLIRGSSAPAMPLSPPLAKRTKMRDLRASPYAVPPGMESPPALSAGIGSSPRLTRAVARLHSPPPVALDPFGRPPPGLASALFSAVAVTCATAADPRALERGVAAVSDSRTSFVVEQRVDQLLAVNSNSTSSYAFRGDPEELRDLVGASVRAQAFAANDNSLAAEQGHYHLYWMPYCDQQFTPYIRPDLRRLSFDEAQLEEAWWGGAIPWIQKRMPNGQGIIGAALPQSILKVVRNIRRAHKRQGIETASLGAAVRATDGLLKEFLLEHGALALVPKRKEPLTNEEIAAMFRYSGPIGATRSKKTLDWLSSQYSSLLAMFHTLAQTGMRKGEVSLPPKVRFDKSRLSMRNIRWRIGGVVYDELTPELYARLCSEGGYALLRPPPSKADPFSLHWGPCTIYLRYDATENINAARELAREEMRRCVPLSERESTPLFVTSDGAAWRHQELATVFHQIVTAVCGDARAKQVSMHSWRVYLACALLSKGASFATIQAMLRWKSEDALRIYARMNDFVYADWLSSAQGALISSVRTTTSATDALSAAPDPGTLAGALLDASHAEANAMRDAAHSSAAGCAEAGFHDEWRRRAACAIDAAVRDAHTAEEQPVYDAYGSLAGLHSSMSTLMLEADRADAEDVALLRE